MTTQLTNDAFNDALTHKKMIFGALKNCYITRQHPDFDDYFQNCLLYYVDAYCEYERLRPRTIDRKNYIYTKLCQAIRDLYRQQQCYHRYFGGDTALTADLGTPESYANLALQELLQQLTQQETHFFKTHYLEEYSVPETCRQMRISRRTLYRLRHRVMVKAKNFF